MFGVWMQKFGEPHAFSLERSRVFGEETRQRVSPGHNKYKAKCHNEHDTSFIKRQKTLSDRYTTYGNNFHWAFRGCNRTCNENATWIL
jgi:hypothetical protein